MSKIGQWNLQMEEDASDMSKDEFVKSMVIQM